MKLTSPLNWVLRSILIFSVFISASAVAGDPLITASFSGIWDQPEQESQGIILQIGEQGEDEKVGIAYWFTYGPDLKSAWYLGVGPVTGNQIDMVLYTASDIGFMAENLEGDLGVVPVGSLNLVFRNCNKGTANYVFNTVEGDLVIETESGEFPIKRISSIYRQRCSGGISDDTPKGGKPLRMDVRLFPVAEDGVGEGKAMFWQRTDRSDFKVEVEGVPASDDYRVRICADNANLEVPVMQFDMVVTDGEGELEFRSPGIADEPNLIFDPRGCKIELLDDGDVVLTTGEEVLSEKMPGKPNGGNEGLNLEADMTNTGVIEGATGEAEYKAKPNELEFSVKIKRVPVGIYAIDVGSLTEGEIEIVEVDGEFYGKVKFTDPQKEDTLELDFNPLGQVIEVRQIGVENPQVILDVLFPYE